MYGRSDFQLTAKIMFRGGVRTDDLMFTVCPFCGWLKSDSLFRFYVSRGSARDPAVKVGQKLYFFPKALYIAQSWFFGQAVNEHLPPFWNFKFFQHSLIIQLPFRMCFGQHCHTDKVIIAHTVKIILCWYQSKGSRKRIFWKEILPFFQPKILHCFVLLCGNFNRT